jgi:hypothetical protein
MILQEAIYLVVLVAAVVYLWLPVSQSRYVQIEADDVFVPGERNELGQRTFSRRTVWVRQATVTAIQIQWIVLLVVGAGAAFMLGRTEDVTGVLLVILAVFAYSIHAWSYMGVEASSLQSVEHGTVYAEKPADGVPTIAVVAKVACTAIAALHVVRALTTAVRMRMAGPMAAAAAATAGVAMMDDVPVALPLPILRAQPGMPLSQPWVSQYNAWLRRNIMYPQPDPTPEPRPPYEGIWAEYDLFVVRHFFWDAWGRVGPVPVPPAVPDVLPELPTWFPPILYEIGLRAAPLPEGEPDGRAPLPAAVSPLTFLRKFLPGRTNDGRLQRVPPWVLAYLHWVALGRQGPEPQPPPNLTEVARTTRLWIIRDLVSRAEGQAVPRRWVQFFGLPVLVSEVIQDNFHLVPREYNAMPVWAEDPQIAPEQAPQRRFHQLDIHRETRQMMARADQLRIFMDAFFSERLPPETWRARLNLAPEEDRSAPQPYDESAYGRILVGGVSPSLYADLERHPLLRDVPITPHALYKLPHQTQWQIIVYLLAQFVVRRPESPLVEQHTTEDLLRYVVMAERKLIRVIGCPEDMQRLLLQIMLFVMGHAQLRYYFAANMLYSGATAYNAVETDSSSCAKGYYERIFTFFLEALLIVCCEEGNPYQCQGRFAELCSVARSVMGTISPKEMLAKVGEWLRDVPEDEYAEMTPDQRRNALRDHLVEAFVDDSTTTARMAEVREMVASWMATEPASWAWHCADKDDLFDGCDESSGAAAGAAGAASAVAPVDIQDHAARHLAWLEERRRRFRREQEAGQEAGIAQQQEPAGAEGEEGEGEEGEGEESEGEEGEGEEGEGEEGEGEEGEEGEAEEGEAEEGEGEFEAEGEFEGEGFGPPLQEEKEEGPLQEEKD